MNKSGDNRFEDFFADEIYVTLKNGLYNYLLRKRAIEREIQNEKKGLMLEVGSGLSPVVTSWDRIVYSDISYMALKQLKNIHGSGHYVVADSMNLPFKKNVFTHVISSEVLEHIAEDRKALREIVRAAKTDGIVLITFPHRRLYFAYDDRFVNHYRRYELDEIMSLLEEVGFHPVMVRKVLGPLDKITMIIVTRCLSLFQKDRNELKIPQERSPSFGAIVHIYKWANRLYAAFVWFDALIMPRVLSTVLMVKAIKK